MTSGAGRALAAVALSVPALGAAAYWTAFRGRSQLCGPFPFRAATDERVIALSFDDGPNEPYTSRILDTLGERDVRATFFQVGRCATRFPAVTRRVVAEGHVLGNHSMSHAFHRYLSEPRQRQEVAEAQRVLADIAGVTPALYRPPWLCHFPWVLRTIQTAGMTPVSGVFGHPGEIFQPPAERLADATAAAARPGTILILHDGREARGGPRGETAASVGLLIDRLTAQDYRFVTVDELLGVPAYG